MIPARTLLLALLIAATPVVASAEGARFGFGGAASGQIDGGRRDKDRQEAENGRRLSLGEVVRIVQSGREGRMLGVRPSGDTAVVRWEYPNGRIADITVDARSGRIIGER